MIWTLVIFGITLFILKRYVFGPVGQVIEKRRDDIAAEHRGGRAQPRRGDRAARGLQGRASPRRATEADRLREQGRKEGERQKAEIVSAGPGPARARPSPTPRPRSRPRPARPPAACATTSCSLALLAAEKVSRRVPRPTRTTASSSRRRSTRPTCRPCSQRGEAGLVSVAAHLRGGPLRGGHRRRRGRRGRRRTSPRSPRPSRSRRSSAQVLDNPEIDRRAPRGRSSTALSRRGQPARSPTSSRCWSTAGRIGRAPGDRRSAFAERVDTAEARLEVEAITAVPAARPTCASGSSSRSRARPAERSSSPSRSTPRSSVAWCSAGRRRRRGRLRPPPLDELRRRLQAASVNAALAPS